MRREEDVMLFIKVHPRSGGERLLNPEHIVWLLGDDKATVCTTDGELRIEESVTELLALIERAEEKRRSE